MTKQSLDSEAGGSSWWPSAGQSLFLNGGSDPVEFHGYLAESFSHPEAYRRAAEMLYEAAVDKPCDRDAIMLPFVFLWRHHVEVSLKRLIETFHEINHDRSRPPPTHKLSLLWAQVRPELVSIWPKANQDPLIGIDEAIAELEQLDRTGETWRYSTDRNGNSIVPVGLKFSLSHFHNVMQGISNLIDGCHATTSEHLSDLRESMRGCDS
ncbi:MAG: hypothetical protein JNM86_07430 [Phycisphaerae bacterium]|nr:hypothetical protein [Phycisphaerae bacterium]